MKAPAWLLGCLAVFLVTAFSGCTAPVARSSPAYAASPQAFAEVRHQVEERISKGRYPGAVFVIARGDRVLDAEAVGQSRVDTNSRMQVDSVFRLMSMTKPVTGAAAMILVEKGVLHLDDPVSRLLPEFANFGVPGAPPLTLRHLMTHTSGIGFGSIPTGAATLASRAQEIAHRPMQVPAGKLWAYSGFDGPDVIARLVEVVSGEPFDRFVQRHIFDPLDMKDTTYVLTPAQEQRLVGLYAAKDGHVTQTPPLLPNPSYPSGGAGLYSTAADFVRFAQMLAGDGALGGVRVLKKSSVAEMRRAQLPLGFPGLGPGLEQGLLMRRVGDPVAAHSPLPVGAYGWSGAYGTHFWVDPATGLVAVWMINLTTAGGASSPDALDFESMVMDACKTNKVCGPR